MKENSKKLFGVILICFTPLLINAETMGVLHLNSVGVSKETAEAVSSLLSSDLTSYGLKVLSPDAMDAALGERLECYQIDCTVEAGLKAEVDRVVFGSVLKIGEKYIVQVSVVDVLNSEVVWTGSLAAKTAEDLDTVVKRIAKAIVENKKVEAGAEVGMITEEEITQEAKRKKSFSSFGATIFYGFPLSGYPGVGGLIGYSIVDWYETPQFTVETNFDFYYFRNDNERTGWDLLEDINFSFLYLFSKENFSPFIGGGLGPCFSVTNGKINIGMGFNGAGGVVLFRTYDFHIIVDVQFALNYAKIPNYETPHSSLNFGVSVVYRRKQESGGCL